MRESPCRRYTLISRSYVSTYVQNNPTYEYWPSRGVQQNMAFLNDTVPVNLYPLTWLLPNGKLFLQAGYKTILYDMDAKTETPLTDMPYSLRVYPGKLKRLCGRWY